MRNEVCARDEAAGAEDGARSAHEQLLMFRNSPPSVRRQGSALSRRVRVVRGCLRPRTWRSHGSG